jgi:hypothetical protein
VLVARDAGCIVRTFVMVTRETRNVEAVDDVRALKVLLPKMRSTVSKFFFLTDCVKRSVALVAWVTLAKRPTAPYSRALILAWCWVARSAGTGFLIQGSKSNGTVARGKVLAPWASRGGRGGVLIPPTTG